MSVRIMSEVFSRYPNGGGEMLLALALADHADDAGENIFPKIEALADKTRQSARSVQRQLRLMEESGWLIPAGANHGGRSRASWYRISPEWIKGDNLSPIQKGDIDDEKGRHSRQERVTPVSPARNRQEPSGSHQGGARASKRPKPKLSAADLTADYGIPEDLAAEFLAIRRDKKLTPTPTAIDRLITEFEKAGLSTVEGIRLCCEKSWAGFKASWRWKDEEKSHGTSSERSRGGGRGRSAADRSRDGIERFLRQQRSAGG